MGVFQRAERGGSWYYRFMIKGEIFKGPCIMPNGKRAQSEADALICEEIARKAVDEAAPRKLVRARRVNAATFGLAQAYALHFKAIEATATDNHKASLRRHAMEAIAYFRSIGKDNVADIDDNDCAQFRSAVIKRHRRVFIGGQDKEPDANDETLWKELGRRRSPGECNHVLNALRSAFKAASRVIDQETREPVIARIPFIEPVKVPKREPTPMSDDEFRRRREVAPPWVQDAADLARHFGLRLSETLLVTVDHLNYDRRGLTLAPGEAKRIDQQHCLGTPEGWEIAKRLARQARARGVKHLVTWPGVRAAKLMQGGKHVGRRPLSEVPVEVIKWEPLTTIRRAWNQTAEAAGIEKPHRFHDLRAAYVTEVAKGEKSGKKIQEIARHKSFTTTERYIGLVDDDLSGTMDKVAAARGGRLLSSSGKREGGYRRPTPRAKNAR